jgi:hypothetical protein
VGLLCPINFKWEGALKYFDIQLLLEKNQAPSDWKQIDNEDRDGGSTSYCLEDVLLTISFSVVWRAGKPFASYQFKYVTTTIAWFELPLISADELPPIEKILTEAMGQMSAT